MNKQGNAVDGGANGTKGPLHGVRVLDLGTITAGAATSCVFADFGADVIKVESIAHIDPFRAWRQVSSAAGSDDYDRSPPFHTVNRGKRSVGINLKTDRGRDLLLALVRSSDVVVENFRRGVLERLRLTYADLYSANPAIVLLSLTSQGVQGPESRYASFGSTLDALGGLMSVTGYDATTPRWSGNNVNYPDQLVSFLAPGVVLAALRQAESSGVGTWIDFSQREAVTFSLGEQVMAASISGVDPVPVGNRAHDFIQGVYPTVQDDKWVALSIKNDDTSWADLARVVGLDQSTPSLTSPELRWDAHDQIDQGIARWTSRLEPAAIVRALNEAGIAASPVADAVEVLNDEQLTELGFFKEVETPLGVVKQRGFSARLSATPGSIRSHAPNLGEHTIEVLKERLAVADEIINGLVRDGVLDVSPQPVSSMSNT
jgi:crotonobetainyl-CoA:carnitine CoA-transferase CaiB-like acyl-CoA transferase